MGKARKQRGTISKAVHEALKERSGGLCEICRKPASHAHHLKTRARGGDSSLENILNVCQLCHQKIHAGTPGFEKYLRHSWEKPQLAQSPAWQNTMVFGRPPKD